MRGRVKGSGYTRVKATRGQTAQRLRRRAWKRLSLARFAASRPRQPRATGAGRPKACQCSRPERLGCRKPADAGGWRLPGRRSLTGNTGPLDQSHRPRDKARAVRPAPSLTKPLDHAHAVRRGKESRMTGHMIERMVGRVTDLAALLPCNLTTGSINLTIKAGNRVTAAASAWRPRQRVYTPLAAGR